MVLAHIRANSQPARPASNCANEAAIRRPNPPPGEPLSSTLRTVSNGFNSISLPELMANPCHRPTLGHLRLAFFLEVSPPAAQTSRESSSRICNSLVGISQLFRSVFSTSPPMASIARRLPYRQTQNLVHLSRICTT